jgi:hypothetical protein
MLPNFLFFFLHSHIEPLYVYSFTQHPVENTQYRLVSDVTRDPERWNTSVRTHTEWTFWSKKQEEVQTDLPLLSLDYKVATDMNGNSMAGPLSLA